MKVDKMEEEKDVQKEEMEVGVDEVDDQVEES